MEESIDHVIQTIRFVTFYGLRLKMAKIYFVNKAIKLLDSSFDPDGM
jgi:hypothetical protein